VIDADIAEGTRLGVTGVPTWYLNGRPVQGHRPLETMRKYIETELAAAK
jgi:protein-disulfide isomerase